MSVHHRRWLRPYAIRKPAAWTVGRTEEFYDVTTAEPDLPSLQAELRAWETVYNTIRPHQSLGYLTPAEYLASVGVHL